VFDPYLTEQGDVLWVGLLVWGVLQILVQWWSSVEKKNKASRLQERLDRKK
jgi:hypothetical protein